MHLVELEENSKVSSQVPDIDTSVLTLNDRLIVISNRLPVSVVWNEELQEWKLSTSSGGLVAGLSSLGKNTPFLWIGWIGIDVPLERQPELSRLLAEKNLYPVYLPPQITRDYYNGFCNDILWPLFHYNLLPTFEHGREMRFDMSLWDAYVTANECFADVVNSVYQNGDIIWIHDYHLMTLPAMIRQRIPSAKIGWFLHTPFPASDIYRILPVREAVLEGVLMSDLLGFHSYDYARNFITCCQRVLQVETSPRMVYLQGHSATIGVFPIGIDPEVFENLLLKDSVMERLNEIQRNLEGKRLIIGVDRMDYIKGIPHKLAAFSLFLQKYPEWQDKVVLMQIAVPSRTEVTGYQQLLSQVNRMVGKINGTFDSIKSAYPPVHHLFQSVKQDELAALYAAADMCIVSSVRDGMNLVSHEYVACQQSNHGVLVISEFAGAAQSLAGAMLFNPWNTEQLADTIYRCLEMSATERQLKQKRLYSYVRRNTAALWGKTFIEDLMQCWTKNDGKHAAPSFIADVRRQFEAAHNRVVILDYEGTLVRDRIGDVVRPDWKVLGLLQKLSKIATVWLMSSYSRRSK